MTIPNDVIAKINATKAAVEMKGIVQPEDSYINDHAIAARVAVKDQTVSGQEKTDLPFENHIPIRLTLAEKDRIEGFRGIDKQSQSVLSGTEVQECGVPNNSEKQNTSIGIKSNE